MSRHNTFAINRPVLKKLYLRISNELDHVKNYRQAVGDAALIFAPYFAEVEVLFASEQEKIINKLKTIHTLISLDKEIRGHYNLNISRVYCFKTGKYLRHFDDPNNQLIFNDLTGHTVILYDHDIVGGKQFADVTKKLQEQHCVVKPFVFVHADKDTEEVLDLRDFLLNFEKLYSSHLSSGLLVEDNTKLLHRISYLHDQLDFEARTSIPLSARNTIRTQISSFKSTYGIKL